MISFNGHRQIWLLVFLAVICVTAVNRKIFKSCEESSFCRRCRRVQPGLSSYELQLETVTSTESSVTAELVNSINKVKFQLVLTILKDSTFRLEIDELIPIKPRYRVEYVLEKDPDKERLDILERSRNSVTVGSASGVKAVLHGRPFKVDFYNAKDQLAVTANQRGMFHFEHQRTKPTPNVLRQTRNVGNGQNSPQANQIQTVEVEAIPSEGQSEGVGNRVIEEPDMWEEKYNNHLDTKPLGPTAVALDFTFPGAEHVYGLPEHAERLALKSTKKSDPYRLYNLDVIEYELENPMSLYVSIPFMLAQSVEKTAGLFWHNTAETWVDVDNSEENYTSNIAENKKPVHVETYFMSESGIVDVFVMLGPKPHDVFRQYTKLTGTSFLPPLFSLAYHQCRWNYNDQDDVHNVSTGFDYYGIPMDVMWLDIEHTDNKKYFTWDPIKFSNPVEMLNNLTAVGRKLVAIIDVHVKRDPDYYIHNYCEAKGFYVKNPDGSVFKGECWPGPSSYPDVLNPAVRQFFSDQYKFDKYIGSTEDLYVWNDMNEPSVFNGPEITLPKDVVHYGGWEHRDIHNIYGMLFVTSTYEGLLNRANQPDRALKKRPFILSRSGFAGLQRYSAIWTGDNAAEWEHLAISIPMCLSFAIAGMSFCGADVGGFLSNPDKELFIRWYQAGAFLPFYRGHSMLKTKRREPWLYGPEATKLVRKAIIKRYTMLPYWYTQFYIHNQTGAPVIRPLWAEFPEERDTFTIDNEFFLGDSILVRPVTKPGVEEVSVYFPGNSEIWYDFDTYQPTVSVNGYVNVSVNLQKIPVYIRGGSIIPLKLQVRKSSQLMHNDPYTLIVALKQNETANGKLYIDDGSTFQHVYYKKSLFLSLKFENKELSSTFLLKDHHYETQSKVESIIILYPSPPSPLPAKATAVKLKSGQSYDLETSYDPDKIALTIKKTDLSVMEEWKITLL